MLPVIIKGLITGGWSFFTKWKEGKHEEALEELSIKKEERSAQNQIRLENARSGNNNTSERIKQMANSFKDEFTMIVVFAPFVTSIISPYLDLYFALKDSSYQQGMLADASLQAVQSLNEFPLWYVVLVILMVLWSWGASKEVINRFLDMIPKWRK